MVLLATMRGKFKIILEVSVQYPGHKVFSQKKKPFQNGLIIRNYKTHTELYSGEA